MKKLKDFDFKIVEKFKIFGPIALAILLAGLIVLFTAGMNVGLDFAGGAKVNVSFDTEVANQEAKFEEIKTIIENNGFTCDGTSRWSEGGDEFAQVVEIGISYKDANGKKLKNTDEQKEFAIKLGAMEDEDFTGDTLVDVLVRELDVTNDYISCRIVSGYTSNITLRNALFALLIAVIVILVYIIIRFTLSSGLAAIIALCHDVLIMIALTVIFQVEVNVSFIAAVITIVGYSINATIVIFDRIRELKKQSSFADADDAVIANKAIKDTFGRSVLTTITTLVAIIVLSIVCAIMNVTSMSEFALPIIFGLVAGFYSSVFLSSSIWVYLRKLGKKIASSKKSK